MDLLLLGSKIVAILLTRIINNSIQNGVFPTNWKKGNCNTNTEERKPEGQNQLQTRKLPCSGIESIRKIICEQIPKHMESNKLLPKCQHGFREKNPQSIAALSEIQRDWTENTENKKITEVLFWDLLSAFDY